MCQLLHIEKTRSTSMHPQVNDSVERFNRTLVSMMKMYCQDNQANWDKYLPQLLMAYRSSKHASTGVTPNKMMLGREITLPVQAFICEPEKENRNELCTTEYIDSLQEILSYTHNYARKHLKQSNEYQKKHYDQGARKRELQLGQAVWLHDPTRKIGVCSKLLPKWKGPYVVVRKIDDLTYMVKRSPRQQAKVYHIDRLLPYKGRNPPTWYKGTTQSSSQR